MGIFHSQKFAKFRKKWNEILVESIKRNLSTLDFFCLLCFWWIKNIRSGTVDGDDDDANGDGCQIPIHST